MKGSKSLCLYKRGWLYYTTAQYARERCTEKLSGDQNWFAYTWQKSWVTQKSNPIDKWKDNAHRLRLLLEEDLAILSVSDVFKNEVRKRRKKKRKKVAGRFLHGKYISMELHPRPGWYNRNSVSTSESFTSFPAWHFLPLKVSSSHLYLEDVS